MDYKRRRLNQISFLTEHSINSMYLSGMAKTWNHSRPCLVPIQNEKNQGFRVKHTIVRNATNESILAEDGIFAVETVALITMQSEPRSKIG